jgi:hypothetical protein
MQTFLPLPFWMVEIFPLGGMWIAHFLNPMGVSRSNHYGSIETSEDSIIFVYISD